MVCLWFAAAHWCVALCSTCAPFLPLQLLSYIGARMGDLFIYVFMLSWLSLVASLPGSVWPNSFDGPLIPVVLLPANWYFKLCKVQVLPQFPYRWQPISEDVCSCKREKMMRESTEFAAFGSLPRRLAQPTRQVDRSSATDTWSILLLTSGAFRCILFLPASAHSLALRSEQILSLSVPLWQAYVNTLPKCPSSLWLPPTVSCSSGLSSVARS